MARARDRQEGRRLRPDRPQAQAADHDAAPRAPARGPVHRGRARHVLERGDPRPLRQLDLHRQHPREGRHDPRGRGRHRGVQEAASGRAADARQRPEPPARTVLRPEALRPDQGRAVQAEPAPRGRRPAGRSGADDDRHRRARQAPGESSDEARRARGLEGLRRGLEGAVARPDPQGARRVRALREPPAAHRRRADPGGVPGRPLPDGAGRPRANDHRGRGHDHAPDDHQRPAGPGGAQGVLRLLAALAVHGSDQLARRAHPPSAPLGARRGRPHPRARPDRGARRPPDPLRAHVPDRDSGRPEHRVDRLAGVDGDRVRVRIRPDAVPRRQEREGDRRDRVSRRERRGEVHDRPGQRADRPEDRPIRQRQRPLPSRRGRLRVRRAQGHPVHGREPGADRLRRDGADPLPRAQRREPRPDGLEHAAAGSAAAHHRPAARRHRTRVSGRDRHRRRRPRDAGRHRHRRRRGAHRGRRRRTVATSTRS